MVLGLVLAAGMLQGVAWAGSTVDRYYIKRAMEAIQQRDFETGAYFLEYLVGYLLLLMVEVRLHLIEPLTEFGNVH